MYLRFIFIFFKLEQPVFVATLLLNYLVFYFFLFFLKAKNPHTSTVFADVSKIDFVFAWNGLWQKHQRENSAILVKFGLLMSISTTDEQRL